MEYTFSLLVEHNLSVINGAVKFMTIYCFRHPTSFSISISLLDLFENRLVLKLFVGVHHCGGK